MESWIVWLVLAAVLGVAEIMTTTLAFGLIAVGAVVAAVVGVAGAGLPFQLAAFAVASGGRARRGPPDRDAAHQAATAAAHRDLGPGRALRQGRRGSHRRRRAGPHRRRAVVGPPL